MAIDGEAAPATGGIADFGGGGAAGGAAGGGAGDLETGAGGGAAGGDPDWLGQFSADPIDADNPSPRDWLKSKGFKTLDDVVKSYRTAENTIRNGGGLKPPGEGATPEDVAAYHRSIGVPEKPEDYEVKGPDGVELNQPLIDRMRAAALKSGVPKAAFEAQVGDFIAAQMEERAASQQQLQADYQAKIKAWGPEADARIAQVETAQRLLGVTGAKAAALGMAWGAGEALDFMAKIGAGMGEDSMIDGGVRKFGVTAAEAQVELSKQNADAEFAAKAAVKGSPEAMRRAMLIDILAADADRKK